MVRQSAGFLVIDRPERSDVIVAVAGDDNDVRLHRALELYQAGYARKVLIDTIDGTLMYGRTTTELAADYVARLPEPLRDQVSVCPVDQDATITESVGVGRCLQQLGHPSRVLIVTSDYHTRRALSVFRHGLPHYHWSVAAAQDPRNFGRRWWTKRQWAKTNLLEWQKLLWWWLVDERT